MNITSLTHEKSEESVKKWCRKWARWTKIIPFTSSLRSIMNPYEWIWLKFTVRIILGVNLCRIMTQKDWILLPTSLMTKIMLHNYFAWVHTYDAEEIDSWKNYSLDLKPGLNAWNLIIRFINKCFHCEKSPKT